MVKKLFLVFALIGVAAGCAGKTADNPKNAEPAKTSASTSDCGYRGKSGFCITPPEESTPTESGDKVVFKRGTEPKAAQDLVVDTVNFTATPEMLKGNRDFARKGTGQGAIKVLEDVDIAAGKGFYVATQDSSNVLVTAVVSNGDKMYRCTFNAYVADKDALKSEIEACKSLKAAS